MYAEFTRNYDALTETLIENWDNVSEDTDITKETFKIPITGCLYVVLLNQNEQDIIGYQFYKITGRISLEFHTVIQEKYRGTRLSIKAQHEGWRLVFNNTQFRKIVSLVPTYKRHVIRYAELLGMRLEGINRKSYLKNGKIYDQWMYGITSSEVAFLND